MVTPGIVSILGEEGMTWGPKFVKGCIAALGIEILEFGFEDAAEPWKLEWGDQKDYAYIARRKLYATLREGKPGSLIVATMPWALKDGEYLYCGSSSKAGISVAVSGAMARVDEAIAEMVISAVAMLAFLESDRRQAEGSMEI
jgi:hypothetical protein